MRDFVTPVSLSPHHRALSRRNHLLAWNGPLATFLALAVASLAGLLVARLPLLEGLLFASLLVVGGATAIEPLIGLGAALFLGPLWAYVRAEVPQIPAQIAQFFVALALVSWLARGLARRRLRIPSSPLLVPLSVFLGAALVSLWDAVELPVYGVPELIKWIQILLLSLLVSETLTTEAETGEASGKPQPIEGIPSRMRTDPADPRQAGSATPVWRLSWLLGVMLMTGLFQAGMGVWQFGLRGEGPDHFAILGQRFYRAYGTFEQPNPYGGYLGMTLSLAIGAATGIFNEFTSKGAQLCENKVAAIPVLQSDDLYPQRGPGAWPLPFLITGIAVAMGVALAMSWSRGAWLGFASAALAMAIALPRKTHWGLLLVAVLVVGAWGLYTSGLLPASIAARLTDFAQYVRFEDVRGVGINDANYAVIERLAHWQAALEMFRHNLWTGVGFGCYEPAYARFALINWPIALGHAHNTYLTVAAETGLIGLLAYLLLWGTVLWHTWWATRRARGLLRGVAIGLLGTWTHLSVHHLLDNLYVNNVHLHIGVLLGLLAFIIRQTDIPRGASPSDSSRQRGALSPLHPLQRGKITHDG